METEDFERLKAKLGDEFTAEYRVEKDLVMVLVKKKDPTRVKERVKVNPVGLNQDRCGRIVFVNFAFKVNSLDFTLNGASMFLASQLEKYLNNEL